MTLAGLRPGEKLFEEKLMAEEGLKKTKNKLIHMNYSTIIEIVKEAGKIALDESLSQEVSVKGQSDFVTAVDLKINNFLKEKLQNIESSINFFSEEQEGRLIDPCWIPHFYPEKPVPRLH